MKRLCTIVVAAVISLPAVAAIALEVAGDCPPRPAAGVEARKLAGEWFARAGKLAEVEMYSDAARAFACSLRMVEHPFTLFNAARAVWLSGRPEPALEILDRIPALAPDESVVEKAGALEREIREHLAARSPEPGEAPVEERGEPGERTPAADEGPPAAERAPSPLRSGGWVAVGVGGGALVAAIVLQGLAGAERRTTESTRDYAEFAAAERAMDKYQRGAWVGWAVGGAVLVTGAVLLIVGGGEPAAVEVGLAPNGVVLGGRF
jgi:hypothetical protein